MAIQAIETYYKGYKFRSRLEARWAVFFDSLGIRWEYEPEGLNINGVYYLPDFYLPDSHQFFEVKGVLDSQDEQKIQALISAGCSVVIGYSNGEFQACDQWGGTSYSMANKGSSWLCRCRECGKHWFMGSGGAYTCLCCGAYNGDGHFNIVMEGEADRIWSHNELWDVARQARFEHGETPVVGTLVQ